MHFEKETLRFEFLEQSRIVTDTGCLTPCSYTEYKLATEPLKYRWENLTLNIKLTGAKVLKRTEQMLYPTTSFVSEFGGALGLFLGISFMTIWDALDVLVQYCLKYNGKT